jgi:ParB family chromosome partitioning protein
VLALEGELADSLGLRVSLTQRGEGGSLTLHYRSLEQLDDLLDRLRR